MKKYSILLILSFFSAKEILADHTKGGWMYYEYIGAGTAANTSKYRITLKLYTECILGPNQFNPTINFSIYDLINGQLLSNIPVTYSDQVNIQNCNTSQCYPCINSIPSICYKIITYELVRDLPKNLYGYTIAYQRCCRITGIANIESPSNSIGETWTVNIPGTLVGAETNSSARFSQNDTAIVCQNSSFTFDFSAIDSNNDSLVYSFTPAYVGGSPGNSVPTIASPPPYSTIPYAAGFSGINPMGSNVTINHETGIVSGIAPYQGIYVVTVTVTEYRRNTNIVVGEVRKSLHIQVANCSLTSAILNPEYVNCDGFSVLFENQANSSNIQTYNWEFGDGGTSTDPAPTHTYSDTGIYPLKLVVNRGLPCSDSATALVKVYPGFRTGFTVTGQCKNTPIQFTDTSSADYGIIDSWHWTFGDPLSGSSNTSILQHPTHVYATATTYNVAFIVNSSKGCRDTVYKNIQILNKPAFTKTNDTLICSIDTLQLNVTGNGSVIWSPDYMINNVNSLTPLVSPDITTTYYLQFTDPFGCIGNDSVKISVVDFVTQFAPNDTTICQTDAIVLNVASDALYFNWTPDDGSLNDTKIMTPIARPLITTLYHVVGSIGKCIAENDIRVTSVPYPDADAGSDQTICIGNSTQLHASGGVNYSWSPTAFLSAANIANPVVNNPSASIRYILTVTDVQGCPKPTWDTIIVAVSDIQADAGPRDTSVVIGQPLQLNASGSTNYSWTPSLWLDNATISNPVALPQNNIEYIVRVSNDIGCFDTDSIRVKLYKVKPDLFVPSAFTPNGDGNNDVFRPIPIGMKSLNVFRIYNRWGQLLYSGTGVNARWDGSFKGKGQDAATYIWEAEGIDYLNNKIKRKGHVVLIR